MTAGADVDERLLVVGGRTQEYWPEHSPILVGRTDSAAVLLEHPLVSREHARLLFRGGAWLLEDLHSTNGTWCGGEPVERLPLSGEVRVRFGDPGSGPEVCLVTRPEPPGHGAGPTGERLIGRDPSAWLRLDDPMVSWRHARLDREAGGWYIADLGSTNQLLVNGEPVDRHRLVTGDRVLIGNSLLVFDAGTLLPLEESRFVVDSASLEIKGGRRIVDSVSFAIARPSLVAVIGPSGAGKSSLLRLVTGQVPPTSGAVSLDGATMTSQRRAHRGQIGVVPQHTVVHRTLTTRQALHYTARLRLAGDVHATERTGIIERLLEQLGLTPHASTRISRLSGGQQRRVGIAMEMLTDPSMLILDEPTAGLDPSLVLQIMNLLRELADNGKRVFVVTHDLEHLALVDQVLVLRVGGTVAYYGPPGGVFAHFGTASWAETFSLLSVPEVLGLRPDRADRPTTADAYDLPQSFLGGARMWARSGRVVLARQLRIIASDPAYIFLLLAMPVALGVLALAVPGSDGMAPTTDPTSTEAARLLVLVIVGAAFLGLSTSIRDLVGEREIYDHEREAGLSPLGYLTAKLLTFSCVAAVQSAILVWLLLAFREPPQEPLLLRSGSLELAAATMATALTGVALGLAISARVRTTEQSMPPLVFVVMGQLVMCGGLFPVAGRGVLEWCSWLFPTRWGYAAAASTVDLNRAAPAMEHDDLWVHTVSNWAGCMLPLLVLATAFTALAATGVARRRAMA